MKKRSLAFLLAMVLVMSAFVGCSGGKDAATDAPAEKKEEVKKEEPKKEAAKEAVVGDPYVVMDNVDARKAIAKAFDKTFITDELLGNGSLPINFFVPDGIGVNSKGEGFRSKYPDGFNPYNVEEAKAHWEAAKAAVGFDTVEIEFLTYDSDNSKKISEFIKEQLETNLEGLTLKLNLQPFENKLKLADEGKFQFQFAGWGPDYPDPMTFMDMWVTGGGHNDAGYKNPAFDEIIDRTKTGDLVTQLDARFEALQDGEKMLIGDDAVLAPLYQRTSMIAYQDYVDGIVKHDFGGDYTYDKATSQEINGEKVFRKAATSDIPSMDTTMATDAASFEVLANTAEGLIKLGENDVVMPAGATEWEVSEDGLTYTFKLNEKSVWSMGEKITADDYVFAWRRAVNPNTGAQYNFMVTTAGVANAQKIIDGELPVEELGVKALDDYTLEVTLDYPVPYFVKLMAFGTFMPLNQEFVENLGDKYGTSVETSLYNGPFVLDVWENGYAYEIKKNDKYWNADEVTLDRVTWRIVKDDAAMIALYEDGEIDRAVLRAEFVERYIDDPNVILEPQLVTFYLVFNIDKHE